MDGVLLDPLHTSEAFLLPQQVYFQNSCRLSFYKLDASFMISPFKLNHQLFVVYSLAASNAHEHACIIGIKIVVRRNATELPRINMLSLVPKAEYRYSSLTNKPYDPS
jgi:hypothetical protein